MHRPSFMRSASSKAPPPPSPDRGPPDESLTPRPPGAPTLPHPRPAASTRATLTSNISKGFAALAGTAATVGGNVGHYAKAAVKGDATVLGGDEGGWRDSFGGWVGRKRSNSWIGKDQLLVFPGWAVKRPLQLEAADPDRASPSASSSSDPNALVPFEIRLQLSLFASSARPESAASRTQRLFTRMARSFADLPRIPHSASLSSATSSTFGSAMPSPAAVDEVRGQESLFFKGLPEERERAGDRTLSGSPEPLIDFGEGGEDVRTPMSGTKASTGSAGKTGFFDGDDASAAAARGGRTTAEPGPIVDDQPTPTAVPVPQAAAEPVVTADFPYAARKRTGPLPNHRSPSVGAAVPPQLSPSLGTREPSTPPKPRGTSSLAPSSASPARSSTRSSTASSAATDDLAALARMGELQKLHSTMRARLQPFFATVIPHRDVRIDVRPVLVSGGERRKEEGERDPLWSKVVQTTVNGTYDAQIVISWDEITSSPSCLDLIFPERLGLGADSLAPEWSLEVTATLLQPGTGEAISDSAQAPWPSATAPLDNGPASRSSVTVISLDRSLPVGLPPDNPLPVVARRKIPLSTHDGIRVISDLDDTVKRTDLVGGLREVFRNVFCRDVTELEVDGMAALYRSLLPAVKGFHYVSNSPLELFEPIHSFLHANAFPEGFSLKLKFYGGRSLFHGLWEPAGERKARGVLEILEGFPHSRFVCIGDSAEQDLDLYTAIALERPEQILGIFIRDVSAQPARSNTMTSFTPLDSSASSSASSTSSSSSSTTTTTTSGGRSRSSTLERFGKPSAFLPSALRSGTSSPRSRSGSLLSTKGAAPAAVEQTTATGNPSTDLAAADVILKLQQAALDKRRDADDPVDANAAEPSSLASVPGEHSEDVLDPLYATLPPSPQLTPALVTAAQDNPAELMDEAVSSARAKALRRADEFRGRFDKSRRDLRKLGVVVEKFRRVEEIEDLMRDLVNGRPIRR